MKSRKIQKKDNIQVFIEVLQNGELLSKTTRPFDKPGVIYLTSDPDKELTAPFYPLPTDITLVRITERGAEVDLDPNWEGFTTFEGKIEEINSDRRTQYTHILKNGDYGSIAYNDLRILIRVGKDRPKQKKVVYHTGEYKGSFFQLFVNSKYEVNCILIAMIAAFWVFGGMIFGLMIRPDDRPKKMMDLKPEYTLPFIAPKHLSNLPEALQNQYRRDEAINSVFELYKNFTAAILNFNIERHPAIFPNTLESYQAIHKENEAEIKGILEAQRRLENQVLAKQAVAFVAIPSIHGETLNGSLLRLKDKLKIYHENLETTFRYRVQTTKTFKDDPGYDFERYRDISNQQSRTNPPSRIETSNLEAPELQMYQDANQLANYSKTNQSEIQKIREFLTPISVENSNPIGISPSSKFASFLFPESFHEFNQKIALIHASEFNSKVPEKIREPLLGEIDPNLIQKLIQEQRFELQLCFELALRRNQNLYGEMEWQWRLDSRGRISDLELLKSSINDPRMIQCVQKKIARWKFPRPKRGSVQIRYPFQFAPVRG